MIKLPEVTLVCVDCLNYSPAINAIWKSKERINFGEVLFITDDKAYKNLKGVRVELINKITSKEEYSHFMMNNIHSFIDTEFMLVVQYDGYVINPNLWRNEFLDYDYIGAKWWYDDMNVGNGGFSLRSKYIMEACSAESFDEYHPEDDVICREQRRLLEEKYKVKFAPDGVAEKFAYEPNKKNPIFKNNTFGFHGLGKLILR